MRPWARRPQLKRDSLGAIRPIMIFATHFWRNAIIVVGACLACRRGSSVNQVAAGSAATPADADSSQVDTAAGPSRRFDYPNGYYIPVESISTGGYSVGEIALPLGAIHIYKDNSDSNLVLDCSDPLIRADTVDVECPHTPLGDVHVRGAFTAVLQDWQDRNLSKEPILSALVTIERGGEIVFSKRTGFTFWVGD